jgi:hypothetical protein
MNRSSLVFFLLAKFCQKEQLIIGKLSDFGGVHARSEGRKIVKIPRFQYLAFSVNKIWNDY